MKRALVLVFCLLGVTFFALGQESEKEKVVKLLEERNYTLIARTMLPNGLPAVILDGSWDLKVKGDSVYCYLPYAGQAYSLPYGGGEGLNFNGEINSYESKTVRKSTVITFYVKTSEDNYRFVIDVSQNGGVSLRISSNNKRSISFIAYVDTSKKS